MKTGFAGFRPDGIKFLKGLKKNNEREWFQARKDIFDSEVKAPMVELVAALQRSIEKAAPDYLQDPAKCVYRIYRDTRFSKNKTPYKTQISAALKKQGLGRDGSAVFYFHVSPEEVVMAVGSYMPGPEELRALRLYMLKRYEEFGKLCKAAKFRAAWGELQGQQLLRVPKGFDAEHPAADLFRRKQFYFGRELEPGIATTPELYEVLAGALKVAVPVMEFLNRPLEGLAKEEQKLWPS